MVLWTHLAIFFDEVHRQIEEGLNAGPPLRVDSYRTNPKEPNYEIFTPTAYGVAGGHALAGNHRWRPDGGKEGQRQRRWRRSQGQEGTGAAKRRRWRWSSRGAIPALSSPCRTPGGHSFRAKTLLQ